MTIWILVRGALAADPPEDTDFYAFGGEPEDGVTVLTDATVFHDACARVRMCDAARTEAPSDPPAPCPDPFRCACDYAVGLDEALHGGTTLPARPDVWPSPGEVADATARVCDLEPTDATKQFLVGPEGAAGPGASDLLLGATDFFVERAGQELAAWSTERFLAQVCDSDESDTLRPTALLPETCAWVEAVRRAGTAGAELELALPALESDARTLVRHVAEESIRASLRSADAPEQVAVRDGLAAVAVLARVGERVSEGEPLPDAFGSWARTQAPLRRPLQEVASEPEPTWAALALDEEPLVSSLYVASVFVAGLPPTTASLGNTEDGLRLSLIENPATTGEIVTVALVNFGVAELPSDIDAPTVAEIVAAWRLLKQPWTDARTTWLNDRRARLAAPDGPLPPSRVATSTESLIRAGALLSSSTPEQRPAKSAWLGRGTESATALTVMDGPRLANHAVGLLADLPTPDRNKDIRAANEDIAEVLRASRLAFSVWAATDPASAQEAIRQAVRPVGGYRFKRDGDRVGYLALQGYVGAGGGVEVLLPGRLGPAAATVAPTIAVGPELGARLSRSRAHPTNLGFQLQIFDLGTLAAWRIGSPDTDAVPDLALSHVLAPGLNLSVGIPSAPLALLGGVGFVPALRDVRPDSTLEVSEVTVMRIGLSLVVDIPLLF